MGLYTRLSNYDSQVIGYREGRGGCYTPAKLLVYRKFTNGLNPSFPARLSALPRASFWLA